MTMSPEEKNIYGTFISSVSFWKQSRDLSEKEIDEIISSFIKLTWKNGQKVFTIDNFNVILEITNLLTQNDVQDIYDILPEFEDEKDFIWNMPGLEDCVEAAQREIKILTTTEKGAIGAGECKFCPGKELVFTKRQIRRADEGMTIFVRCVTCGRRWRQ